MIYWWFSTGWMSEFLHSLGFYAWANVLFRAMVALLTAFLVTVWFGPRVIRRLAARKIHDRPEFYRRDLNESLSRKTETPTMGGVIIIGAIIAATLLWADISNFYVSMALVVVIWLSILGGIDDWAKLTRKDPKSRQGLHGWEKLAFQVGLGVLIAYFAYGHGENIARHTPEFHVLHGQAAPADGETPFEPQPHALTLPLYKKTITMSPIIFAIVVVIVMTGTSNAVNLTDGMDGLSAGCMTTVAFAFMLLALVADYAGGAWAKYLLMPWVPGTSELAVFCGAILGACIGFLWFNCYPARIFMGDTGSLPLGGAIGYVAVVIRQELMLLIIGGVFVMEAMSVIMQVLYFKATGGRRIFRCAPIHYHFHLGGWTESQTVVRFWLLGAIFAAIALASIKLR